MNNSLMSSDYFNAGLIPKGEVRVYDVKKDHNQTIRCPHCQKLGTFHPYIPKYLAYESKSKSDDAPRQFCEALILACPNIECRGSVYVVLQDLAGQDRKRVIFPAEMIDFDSDGIPSSLVKTLEEAITCHAVGAFRASAMMVRRLLEELCEECGAKGPNLFERLKKLRNRVTLPEELFESTDELKALGNDAAHIEAKEYGNIDAEESETSIMLAKEILKARYQHKLLLDRLRSRKK